MFGLLRNYRRRRVLATRAIDNALWEDVFGSLPALAVLDAESRERLRRLSLLFILEKSIEAAQGLVLDEAMRLRIALLACRPILQLGLDSYTGFVSVVVHPDEFVARDREHEDEHGIVHIGDEVMSGESWDCGPVVLAWEEVRASGQGEGFDVVAHEFAHKLDSLEGAINGMPALRASMSTAAWADAFQAAFDDLLAREGRGEETWLDPYAGESPAEFFAVCSEMFFDVPVAFRRHYPLLYTQLSLFYGQDPAGPGSVHGPQTTLIR